MSVSKGVWSNFSKRSASLNVKNKLLSAAFLKRAELPPSGPITLNNASTKRRYESPIGMDKIYPLLFEILEKESEKLYEKVESLKSELGSNEKQIEELLVKAEKYNPSVMFNARYDPLAMDMTQPVYRYYLKQKWEDYGKMLTMQRLETMSVIPDTLPTLEPIVDVRLKFPHTNVEKWVEPGEILSSNVTSRPPMFEITEFENVPDASKNLYTILIVNPDIPDLEKNSFSTTLQWGLQNVAISNTQKEVTPLMVAADESMEIVSYLPAVPEKNAPTNRLAVWAFKQPLGVKSSLKLDSSDRYNFDIRLFVETNKLTAVGAHLYRSVWDRNVANVRESYGLEKGRVFHRVRR